MSNAPEDLAAMHKEIWALAFEIASIADQIGTREGFVDYGTMDDILTALLDAQGQVAQMGWLADRISMRCGHPQIKGGAEEWLLPPLARPGAFAKSSDATASAG